MLTIISLNDEYVDIAKKTFKNVHKLPIQDYKPVKKNVFYVSPSNSLGFMDGGIDKILSTVIMPGIEPMLKRKIKQYGKTTLLGRKYLPIGSSMIIEPEKQDCPYNKYLISAPTMLLPQDVSETQNCYHATRAVLYNILENCQYKDCEIIFTSMACGWGKMTPEESFNQFVRGVKDFNNYKPSHIIEKCVIDEPNLEEQPLLYENTEWKYIDARSIKRN